MENSLISAQNFLAYYDQNDDKTRVILLACQNQAALASKNLETVYKAGSNQDVSNKILRFTAKPII